LLNVLYDPFKKFPGPNFALPYDSNPPAKLAERSIRKAITFNIALELRAPERLVRGRRFGSRTARVAMPETSAHLNRILVSGKNNVRRARERPDMSAVAKAPGKQRFAKPNLGAGVLRPDAGHYGRSLCRGYSIQGYHLHFT